MFTKLLDNIGSSSEYIKIKKKSAKIRKCGICVQNSFMNALVIPMLRSKVKNASVHLSWNCKSLGTLFLVPRTKQTGTPLLSHKQNRTLYNTLLVLQIDTCLELLRITCDGWLWLAKVKAKQSCKGWIPTPTIHRITRKSFDIWRSTESLGRKSPILPWAHHTYWNFGLYSNH